MQGLESPATRDSQMLCLKMEETGGKVLAVFGECVRHSGSRWDVSPYIRIETGKLQAELEER